MNKKLKIINLILFTILVAGLLSGFSIEITPDSVGTLKIPENSSTCSLDTALQLLELSSGHTESLTSTLMEGSGLRVLDQSNYDKEEQDPAHTCAYTIAEGDVYVGDTIENAIVMVIRGTNLGEWYANFDYCPSHSDDAAFAENFLFCAEDAFLSLKEYIDEASENGDSRIIVSGHSRGAACANLVGVMLNEFYGKERVYVYTSATPATIRTDLKDSDCSNIFNFLNPADMVPRVPLKEWGFKRAGIDIILPETSAETTKRTEKYIGILYDVAPTISGYYNDRHSIQKSGIDDQGITAFDVMMAFCKTLVDLTAGISSDIFFKSLIDIKNIPDNITDIDIAEESDFYPLAAMMKEVTDNNYAVGIDILMQHMPDTYIKLVTQLKEN